MKIMVVVFSLPLSHGTVLFFHVYEEDLRSSVLFHRLRRSISSDMRFLMNNNTEIRTVTAAEMVSNTNTRETDARTSQEHEHVNALAVLRKCRKVVYKPTRSTRLWKKGKEESDQSECPVCLETFVAKDKLLSLPCHHHFHADCITRWIKRNHGCCPVCRADILEGPDSKGKISTNLGSSSISFCPGGFHLRGIVSRHSHSYSRRERSYSHGDDGWEGMQDYIMAALAEVDDELSRLVH